MSSSQSRARKHVPACADRLQLSRLYLCVPHPASQPPPPASCASLANPWARSRLAQLNDGNQSPGSGQPPSLQPPWTPLQSLRRHHLEFVACPRHSNPRHYRQLPPAHGAALLSSKPHAQPSLLTGHAPDIVVLARGHNPESDKPACQLAAAAAIATMAATRYQSSDLRRQLGSPRPKGRGSSARNLSSSWRDTPSAVANVVDAKENKDTLCRNIMIYGNCRYEDQGCAFSHDQGKGKSVQSSERWVICSCLCWGGQGAGFVGEGRVMLSSTSPWSSSACTVYPGWLRCHGLMGAHLLGERQTSDDNASMRRLALAHELALANLFLPSSSKKSLSVESPSFTPAANIPTGPKRATLSTSAATAPAFTPRGLEGETDSISSARA